MGQAEHGTLNRYFQGCRCEELCLPNYRKYRRDVRRKQAYGIWQPFVDAEPSRRHVLALMEAFDCGTPLIAKVSGVSLAQIHYLIGMRLFNGHPTQKVRPHTEARILAARITFDMLSDCQRVPILGTARRVQALQAAGFPRNWVVTRYNLSHTIGDRMTKQPHTIARVAREVARAYDELKDADPIECGVLAAYARQSRELAVSRRWAPPHCWDDGTIDSPDAIAEWTGMCGTHEGYSAHRREGIPTCDPCRNAEWEWRAERRGAPLDRRARSVRS